MTTSNYGFRNIEELGKGNYDRIPTGSFFLDVVLGGGYVAGSIVELMGEPQTGKSFLAAKALANIQAGVQLPSKSNTLLNQDVAWIDIEDQLSKEWLTQLGVDLTKFYVQAEYDFMEEALECLLAAARDRLYGGIVYDSVGASIPALITENDKKSIGETMVTSTYTRAKLMGIASRTLVQYLRMKPKDDVSDFNPTLVIFLNHLQVDVNRSSMHYTVMRSPGGDTLKFAATTRIELATSFAKPDRIAIGSKDKPFFVGQKTYFRVKKHRGSGGKEFEGWFTMFTKDCVYDGTIFQAGEIDRVQEIADVLAATPCGAVSGLQKGAWFHINGEKLHGATQLAKFLRENEEARLFCEKEILAAAKEVF